MKLAVDAMGGDHAPLEVVKGVELAIKDFPDLEVILYGNAPEISKHLTKTDRITIVHTDEKVNSDDDPLKAVRKKKNSSMVLAATAVSEGKADAVLSAGNTGAYLAAGLFVVGRIDGIARPALAPVLPSRVNDKGAILLDAGANADAKAEHLLHFGLMGAIYAETVLGIKNPRVGLLNIGTEENKGTELTKEAFTLLKNSNLNFVGNVEARDVLEGAADVLVTDGFTGNMVLKTLEGTAMSVMRMVKSALTANLTSKLAAAVLKPGLNKLKNKMDYSSTGGAAMFGLKAPVIKAHGSSNAIAFYHAIRQAKKMADANFSDEVSKSLLNHNE